MATSFKLGSNKPHNPVIYDTTNIVHSHSLLRSLQLAVCNDSDPGVT